VPVTTTSTRMTISSNSFSRGHAHGVVRVAGMGALIESLGQEGTALYLDEFETRLKSLLRPVDKLVKVATDKYCMVLYNVNQRNHIELAAAKLNRLFALPVQIIDQHLYFKVNAGFVVPSGQALNSKEMIRHAEAALRTAIKINQPFSILQPDEAAHSRVDLSLLPRVERAIERGEMTLFYQAKIDAAYGHVVGAEGLVRWLDSDTRTVRAPGDFIELVEQSELIRPLTSHLVKLAISRCVKWAAPAGIAVNITPALLHDMAFVDTVVDALDVYALEASRLTVEVTERGILGDSACEHLQQLRQHGVCVSIDDFGTGNCSLSYFRDLPADQIKIDQSFVKSMCVSQRDQAIVAACIELAHGCGLKVVAEGVEDQASAAMLRDMGCDILQGYWFGKPVAAAEFEAQHLDGLLNGDDEPDYAHGV